MKKANNILALVLACGALMLLLGLTGLGFIPMTAYRFIDILIVPALIGSMIGISNFRSYVPAVLLGFLWTGVVMLAFSAGSLAAQPFTPWLNFLIPRLGATVCAAWYYSRSREKFPRDRKNVYRGTLAGCIAHTACGVLAAHLTGYYDFYLDGMRLGYIFEVLWQRLLPETIIAVAFLTGIINQLRKFHMLNGVEDKQAALDKVYTALNAVLGTKLERAKHTPRGDLHEVANH